MPDLPTPAPSAASGIPTAAPVTDRLAVSASNALGLTESPSVSLAAIEKASHAKQIPSVGLPAKPAGPKPPTVTKPAAPAATPPAAAPAAEPTATPPAATPPAATPEPPKFKYKGKDYTEAELNALLEQRETPPAVPAAEVPAATQPPAAEVPAQTPEQIAAEEQTWVDDASENLPVSITEKDVETLLGGGKEAVEFFGKTLKQVAARAILEARKSVLGTLNEKLLPRLDAMQQQHNQLFTNYQDVQKFEMERTFLAANPDFQPHIDRAREVGNALAERYPDWFAKATKEQFLAEVAKQTDALLDGEFKRWNPAYKGTWRDFAKTQAPTGVTPAATPAAATPAATPPAAAPAPVAPPVRPPVANAPAAASVIGSQPPSWHKSVAASLQ